MNDFVRLATENDVKFIMDIYNEAIMTTTATFDTEPKTLSEQQAWFQQHNANLPICVYEQYQQVLGWASLNAWSDRCGYKQTAEVSLYVGEQHRGLGIGTTLLGHILNLGEKAQLHTIIAKIADDNLSSIRLHEKFGFETIGTMHEVGKKFGRLLNVTLMQKIFS